ncbi:MAG: hypothetical protein ACLPH3_09680 [Terracidiphilus sp.]
MYDRYEKIAGFAEYPVGVVGNPQTFDFEIVDLRGGVTEWRDTTGRCAYWLGTIGTVNGQPRSELAEPLDAVATAYVGQLYAAHVTRALEAQRAADIGDEIDFLERLYALPDLRV